MSEELAPTQLVAMRPILAAMCNIEGWFLEPEADLLAAATTTALRVRPGPHHVAEVGSYCGRSTIVLGLVVRAVGGPDDRVHAIDPHEGTVGAVGERLYSGEPTLDRFRRTISEAGLDDVVTTVAKRSEDVTLDVELSLLFVDGLHDYASVCGDITQLQGRLVPGGLLACHDYADHYAGVVRAVDDLVATGAFVVVQRVESLVVLRKLGEPGIPALHRVVGPALTVDGWYERDELTCLAWTAARALEGQVRGNLVEVGCHLGRATAVLAGVEARARSGAGRPVDVVDRFDGLLGAVGERVWVGEPTGERFAANMARLGLDRYVRGRHRDRAPRELVQPIALLLIDDLHDYASVAADLRDFEPHLADHAVVAFHSYGWPGVRALVTEIVDAGRYTWRTRVGSLAVLDRVGTG